MRRKYEMKLYPNDSSQERINTSGNQRGQNTTFGQKLIRVVSYIRSLGLHLQNEFFMNWIFDDGISEKRFRLIQSYEVF